MNLEDLMTARKDKMEAEKTPASNDVTKLQGQLRSMIWGSRTLNAQDKASALAFLENDPKSGDPKELKLRIEHFPEAEMSKETLIKTYSAQIEGEIKAMRFSRRSKVGYERWFKGLSYENQKKYVDEKSSALHDPNRQIILDIFMGKREHSNGVRIPEAIRKEHFAEFLDADLECREKLVDKLAKEHKELKTAFLKLPEAVQAKYRVQFKDGGLNERKRLLKVMKGFDGAQTDVARDGKELEGSVDKKFFGKTQQLFEDNLLAIESKAAYDKWFAALPKEKKSHMLDHSELDTRMRERVTVRDEFYALPEETRRPHELRFRNSDLDRRQQILEKIKHPERKQEGRTKYPTAVVRHTLEKTLQNPSLAEARLIYTEVAYTQKLVRRAELSTSARKKEIARVTSERGGEVDQHKVLNIHELRQHGTARFSFKEFLKRKKAKGDIAKATNMELRDRELREVGAEEFGRLIVNHQKAELTARLVGLARQKLPGISEDQLEGIAAKMDLSVDLHRAAA